MGFTGFRVPSLGFRVWGSEFTVQDFGYGSGFGVWDSEFWVEISGFRVQDCMFGTQVSGFRVQGSGFRV